MDMKILKHENTLCLCCMEVHDVKTVMIENRTRFKNTDVSFNATYLYCDVADELYMNEQQTSDDDIAMKDAYRRKRGLLTSYEIKAIRAKYGITQSDLCILLGWGGKTIARYESHQVQDKAHDSILRKLDQDPEWFISLLIASKKAIPDASFTKYFETANVLFENDKDIYLRKAIEANYAKFHGNPLYHGNTALSLDKTVDVIRYFAASTKVTVLYKVKLLKLMWFSDYYSFKIRRQAITGLVYLALPLGAVPVAHDSIIDLNGVPCEEVDMGDTTAYHFSLSGQVEYPSLTNEDIAILDYIIDKLGKMSKTEIVEFMHNERAYIETAPRDVIQFKYADFLHI